MGERLTIYARLVGYLRPYWLQVIVAYASMVLATLMNLAVPKIIAGAIDSGLATGQATALYVAAALILGIAVVRGIMSFGQRYYGEWLTHRVAYDLRNNFYSRGTSATFCVS